MPKLISWTDSMNHGVKCFSVPPLTPVRFRHLGNGFARVSVFGSRPRKVCDIAEVKVNGKPVGVSRAPPYRLDVTADLHPGLSKNETNVTDEWTNRQIGDRTLPENQRVLVPSGVLPDQPGGGEPSGGRRSCTNLDCSAMSD
jgi:hypothetical protein